MTLSRDDLRQMLPAVLTALLLLGAGVALILYAQSLIAAARGELGAARAERSQIAERLSKIADEEREVKEKLAVYSQLRALNIIGEERRLDWADAIARIRAERQIPDVRFRVEPQKLLASLAGKPAPVDIHASSMRLELSMLHEGDLLAFFDDLRRSGNAYYAVRSCRLTRVGPPAAAPTSTARLRGECDVDLITILDHGAKP